MIEIETDLNYAMDESEKSNFRTEEKESEKPNFRHSKKRDYECLKSLFVLISNFIWRFLPTKTHESNNERI